MNGWIQSGVEALRGLVVERAPMVLPYPYPYKSAVAISNDCEFMNWDCFVSTLGAFSGKGGLGLELSTSVFFFATNSYCHSSIGYFEGLTSKPSEYAARFRELIREGFIDTIHAYGDFDRGGFKREMGAWVLEECEKHNLRLPVWTNHGTDQNLQNLGHQRLRNYQQGDEPGSDAYHLDLLRRNGTEFVWVDDGYVSKPSESANLLYEEIAGDGTKLTLFRRYRGLVGRPAPNAGSLAEQIRRDDIDAIIRAGSACIYYQHLGVLRKNRDGTFTSNPSATLDSEAINVLSYLARKQEVGDCLVTSTARLLRFMLMRESVRISLEGATIVVTSKERLDLNSFEGLSVRICDPEGKRIVYRADRDYPLSSEVLLREGKGRGIVGIPWRKRGVFTP